jgi:hypothetical protein
MDYKIYSVNLENKNITGKKIYSKLNQNDYKFYTDCTGEDRDCECDCDCIECCEY